MDQDGFSWLLLIFSAMVTCVFCHVVIVVVCLLIDTLLVTTNFTRVLFLGQGQIGIESTLETHLGMAMGCDLYH